MGITPTASVVYGIPVSMESQDITTTRYNLLSGKPYAMKTQKVHQFLDVMGKRVSVDEFNSSEHASLLENNMIGFGYVSVVGVKLYSMDFSYEDKPTAIQLGQRHVDAFATMAEKYFPDVSDDLISMAQLFLVDTSC